MQYASNGYLCAYNSNASNTDFVGKTNKTIKTAIVLSSAIFKVSETKFQS